jgi:methionine salvage enolase-phosphatase E1
VVRVILTDIEGTLGPVAFVRVVLTVDGDLRPLFGGFFGTASGPKTDSDSYCRIAAAIATQVGEIRFLSDLVGELDAAATAGMQTCWLVVPLHRP